MILKIERNVFLSKDTSFLSEEFIIKTTRSEKKVTAGTQA
jgi:hypothetical protein